MSHRYCARDFSAVELELIRRLIADNPQLTRAALSRLVCNMLSWRRPDGRLKDMSCRVAMLRMQDDGLITLPPPRNSNNNGKTYCRRTQQAEPDPVPFISPAHSLTNLCIEIVSDSAQSHLWNEYIDRYHYLGYQPLPGAQIRYFVRDANRILALLGFGAAAWKTAPRDQFIGWTQQQRKRQLHLVINNARFLILPWVHSKNLASKILAMTTRRIPDDWQQRYGYRPVMVETFVETPRFRGTCYKAANWVHLGETKGRGKMDRSHKAQLPRKSIWVYPLARNYQERLCV
jgi:hypothetical protein